jgi:hypothetical protein
LVLATKAASAQREKMLSAVQLMTTGREEDSFVVGGNKSGWSAFATVEDHPRIPSLAWLWAAYEAAFTAENLVREDFLGALQFGEIDQKLGELDRDLTARYHGPIEYVIKCNSTGYRRIVSEREGFDDLIERARDNCGEDVDAIGFFINTNSFVGELRAVGSEWIKIPISPFFLSSFTVSLLFYLGVVATWLALWVDRKTAQFFSNKYLKTGNTLLRLYRYLDSL